MTKATDTVKAAIYVRVSSEEQAGDDKVSLRVQEMRAESYCNAQGWAVAEVYQDAESGAKADRPALTQLMADAEAGSFQRCVFLKLDRLGRKAKDLLEISERLDKLNVGIVSVEDSFDTGTPSGRLYFTILGAMAEFEREQIRERTRMGRTESARKGNYLCAGLPPFGYDYDPDSQKLVVNEAEAATVRRIYDMKTKRGMSITKIIKELNDEGVPTKNLKALGWHHTQVRRILNNPVYVGKGYYGKTKTVEDSHGNSTVTSAPQEEWIPIDCPPIVSEEQARLVSQVNARNRRESQRPRDAENAYLLSGLIRCDACGKAIVAYTQRWVRKSNKKQYKYRHYFCSGQHNYGTKCRSPERIRAERVEKVVLDLIVEKFSDPDEVLRLCEDYSEQIEAEIAAQEGAVANLQVKLQDVEVERSRLVEAYGKGIISEGDLETAQERLEGDTERWRQELGRLEEAVGQRERMEALRTAAYAIAENIAAITDTQDVATQKRMVRDVVEDVRLTGDNEVIVNFAIGASPASRKGGRRAPVA